MLEAVAPVLHRKGAVPAAAKVGLSPAQMVMSMLDVTVGPGVTLTFVRPMALQLPLVTVTV